MSEFLGGVAGKLLLRGYLHPGGERAGGGTGRRLKLGTNFVQVAREVGNRDGALAMPVRSAPCLPSPARKPDEVGDGKPGGSEAFDGRTILAADNDVFRGPVGLVSGNPSFDELRVEHAVFAIWLFGRNGFPAR